MKIVEAWQHYKEYTDELSKSARALGLGGIGACWVLRLPSGHLPTGIVVALLGLVAFFVLDAAQQWQAAIRYRRWLRREEERMWREHHTIDGEVQKPASLDRAAYALFNVKLLLLLSSFGAIAVAAAPRLVGR